LKLASPGDLFLIAGCRNEAASFNRKGVGFITTTSRPALAKIERGHQIDSMDVRQLIASGLLNQSVCLNCFPMRIRFTAIRISIRVTFLLAVERLVCDYGSTDETYSPISSTVFTVSCDLYFFAAISIWLGLFRSEASAIRSLPAS